MVLSVITVTFQNLAGLILTAESFNLTDKDVVEWIVVDGGSSDGTVEWLKSSTAINLRWISEPDQGIFDAMNKGISRANGSYVIFMNAGDRFATTSTIRSIVDSLGSTKPALLYGDSIEVTSEGRKFYKAARNPTLNCYSMFTHHQSILYRRDKISAGYDLSFYLSGDWALTSRVLSEPDIQVQRYSGVICHFERGGISQRDDRRSLINTEHWRILREVMKISWVFAAALYAVKLGANYLRGALPSIYDKIRFGKQSS